MTNIIQSTPFMHVPDLAAALALMVDVLGFRIDLRADDYAYVSRDNAGLRILETGPGNPFQPGNRRFAHYFDCRDVDALHDELKPRLSALPAHDVHGPADKPYGQRELLILAPDGNLIIFGQAIQRDA